MISATDEFTPRNTFMTESPELPEEVYIFARPCDISLVGDRATLNIPNDSSAYWSLDPEGVDKLREDEVQALGLPQLKFTAKAHSHDWNDSQYGALRQFYITKGSARHLQHPLFFINEDLVETGVAASESISSYSGCLIDF